MIKVQIVRFSWYERVLTYLEHVLTHRAIHAVLERLVLKIELNVVIIGAVAHCNIKEDFDSSFGDWSQLIWLTKFNVVLQHIAVFGSKEDLVDVDAGPGVNDTLDYLLSPLLIHFRHLDCCCID